jgi:hypothetical protein
MRTSPLVYKAVFVYLFLSFSYFHMILRSIPALSIRLRLPLLVEIKVSNLPR